MEYFSAEFTYFDTFITLFRGRYKAILVDGDSYLLELVRYIHRNPLRAGITKRLLQYMQGIQQHCDYGQWADIADKELPDARGLNRKAQEPLLEKNASPL